MNATTFESQIEYDESATINARVSEILSGETCIIQNAYIDIHFRYNKNTNQYTFINPLTDKTIAINSNNYSQYYRLALPSNLKRSSDIPNCVYIHKIIAAYIYGDYDILLKNNLKRDSLCVDHIDHDRLNNNPKNLRIVTNNVNAQNRSKSLSSKINFNNGDFRYASFDLTCIGCRIGIAFNESEFVFYSVQTLKTILINKKTHKLSINGRVVSVTTIINELVSIYNATIADIQAYPWNYNKLNNDRWIEYCDLDAFLRIVEPSVIDEEYSQENILMRYCNSA